MADQKITIDVAFTGDAEIRFRKLTDAVEDFSEKGEKGLSKFSGAFDVLAGIIGSQVVLGAFNAVTGAAGALFDTLIVDGVKAAQETETNITKLNSALIATGKYTREASDDLVAFSDELQRSSKFSNDQVLEAEALIQSLGRLDRDGLKAATRAALDLASGLGVDLQTAAQQVGKAATGELGSFSRLGIKLTETGDKAKDFETALAAIQSRFGGAAEAQVNTYAGAMAILANAVDDAKKEIGFAIIQNQSLINVLRTLSKIVDETADGIKGNRTALNTFVSEGVVLAVEGLRLLNKATEFTVIALLELQRATYASYVAFKLLTAPQDVVAAFIAMRKEISSVTATLDKLRSGNSPFDKITTSLERLGKAAQEGFGKTNDSARRATDGVRNATVAVNELTDAQKKLIAEGERLASQAENKDPALEFQKRLEALTAAREAEKITEQEFNLAVSTFEQERADKKSALLAQEAEQIAAQQQLLLTSQSVYDATAVENNRLRLQRILSDENLTTKDRIKVQQAYSNQSKIIENQRREALTDSLNALATLQTAKTKEIAAVGKAAAIASTIIETYTGATRAASALAGIPIIGPALGAAAAAAFVAAGLARVATISGVQLATGITEVPSGFPNDTFPARLTSGERVVDAGTNEDLKAFLGGANQMIPLLQSIANGLANAQVRTTVNVGQKTLIDEIQNGLRSGRTFDV